MPISLLALALSAFAGGSSEFLVVGIIPDISSDLNVGVPTAGLLVSAYALSIAIGTPIFTALTGRFDRRKLALSLMGLFVLTNIVAALAPGFSALLAARIVMAVAQGVMFGVFTTIATSLVPAEKAGRAVSAVLSGLTVAMVLGVPLGSWIGNTFNWRVPFIAVAVLGILGLIALAALVPKNVGHPSPTGVLAQFEVLRSRRLLAIYAVAALGVAGVFVVFTFLTTLLTKVTDVGEGMVSIALVIFGVGTVAGTYAAGKVTDRSGVRFALIAALLGGAASLAALPFTSHNTAAVLINVGIWGFFGFALPPIISAGAVAAATEEAPKSIGSAAGLSVAAINVGISGGSFLGGRLLKVESILSIPWAAVVVVLIAIPIAGRIKASGRGPVAGAVAAEGPAVETRI